MLTCRRFKSFSLLVPIILGLIFGTCSAPNCSGYSVLTHEAIIDAAWKDSIEPVLSSASPTRLPRNCSRPTRMPTAGAIIQDMGYYPFGNRFFSDLTHYVRTGDFVLALIEESRDLNEYAFALGALAHYAADASGHPLATNRAVAIMYPHLAKEYGPVVTYEEEPSAHMKVEFGFDVDQVAKGHYAPKAYHDFIGFEVSEPVLERAFAKTYSIDMSSVFFRVDLAIGSYRHAASTVIPRTTKVAWHLKRHEIQHGDPSETKTKFIYNISNSGYRKDWGDVYEKPGFFARLKAFDRAPGAQNRSAQRPRVSPTPTGGRTDIHAQFQRNPGPLSLVAPCATGGQTPIAKRQPRHGGNNGISRL